jgi:hypothetical protein
MAVNKKHTIAFALGFLGFDGSGLLTFFVT